MFQRSVHFRCDANARLAALLCLTIGSLAAVASCKGCGSLQAANMANSHMPGHMYMTTLTPLKPGDQQKADAVVAAAKTAMAPYEDYHKALADGYQIFLPNLPQAQYHFTKYEYGREAWLHFDPLKPTSLLYKKTADGGYKLVGVMYTDRVDASEEELNDRIPLSIARWHQHVNFCKAPRDKKPHTSALTQSSVYSVRLPPKKRVTRRAENFILIYSAGWSTSTPMRATRRKSGPQTMTIRDMTIWTTRSCQG